MSPKVVELIVAINAEIELGVSDGMIDFDAFSIMYMMLEHKFKDEKESNKVKTELIKQQTDALNASQR